MEGSVDIFATKGIEYLIVIAFLFFLIGYWRFLNLPRRSSTAEGAKRSIPAPAGWFALKDGYFFHQGHSWAAPQGEELMAVGLDDFAHKLLGRPSAFQLPPLGAHVKQGEQAWQVKVDSRTIRVLSPVDGEVVARNPEVLESPEVAAGDPYDRGWLMKIKTPKSSPAVKNLLSGSLAKAWLNETVEQLRAMKTGDLGILLPDGGFPVDGFARALSEDHWDETAEEFLLTRSDSEAST